MVKVGNEAFAFREKRLENQKNFLASRKVRHDAALEEFQRAVDVLSEECQREVEAATDRVKKDLEVKVVESNEILEPLEPPPLPERPEGEEPLVLDETTLLDELHDLPLDGTIDPAKAKAVAAENAALKALRALGERTEGEVRGILKDVEAGRVVQTLTWFILPKLKSWQHNLLPSKWEGKQVEFCLCCWAELLQCTSQVSVSVDAGVDVQWPNFSEATLCARLQP